MPEDFVVVKQTKSSVLQHFVIQLLHFFALFIIVVSEWTTEKASSVHRAVPHKRTWTISGKKEREVWQWAFDKWPTEFIISL